MIRHPLKGPTAETREEVRYDAVNHFVETTIQGRCIICIKHSQYMKKNVLCDCIKYVVTHTIQINNLAYTIPYFFINPLTEVNRYTGAAKLTFAGRRVDKLAFY